MPLTLISHTAYNHMQYYLILCAVPLAIKGQAAQLFACESNNLPPRDKRDGTTEGQKRRKGQKGRGNGCPFCLFLSLKSLFGETITFRLHLDVAYGILRGVSPEGALLWMVRQQITRVVRW